MTPVFTRFTSLSISAEDLAQEHGSNPFGEFTSGLDSYSEATGVSGPVPKLDRFTSLPISAEDLGQEDVSEPLGEFASGLLY